MRCFAVLLLIVLAGCAQARPSTEQYTHRLGTQDGGLCSATAVGQRTLLTAKHCIKQTDSYVYLGGKRVGVTRIEVDGSDHALLWVDQRFRSWAQRGVSPKKGDPLHFYGNVDGLEQLYRAGYMSGWYGGAFVLEIPCAKGDSGAGVFNEQGQLVSVVSAVYVGPIIRFCVAYPLALTPRQWAGV